MGRPWYAYLLLFIGILTLLGAVFRPMAGATSTAPGAVVEAGRRLRVVPGSPLERAGARTGDRFVRAESVVAPEDPLPAGVRWAHGIPRTGSVELRRGEERVWVEVHPAPPAWPVRLAWSVLGLLNAGLVALALALFWQHPRDGRAVLLGLVLLSAPVFGFPREPRLFALALAAHFFTVFPETGNPTRRRWLRAVGLYAPFVLFGIVGAAWWDQGRIRAAAALFDTLALGYALYGLAQVLRRWRGADEGRRPIVRTLAVAAGATVAAVLAGIAQPLWVVSDQYVPANFLPAVLFSLAMGHLVFRLRALEVRFMARRTLQYVLTRWTLGSLFLIPGFLLVWRFGQLSALKQAARPDEFLVYLTWMFLAAVLLGKRQEVLRNLDRRFFRDVEATRQGLVRLAHDLAGETDAGGLLATLENGVRRALRPRFLRFALADAPAAPETALSVPLQRGERVLGCLELGAKESGEPYSAEERELLAAAAVQAAMGLENARLHGALLARQRAELAARTAGVLTGSEDERRRLAADLHDQVLPELRHIAAEVERLKERANGVAPDLARLEDDIRGTMDSVREVMEALRPSALDMLGLTDALEGYLRKAAARREVPLAVIVRRAGAEPQLSPERSLGLYRICQEAINNLLRHSGARRAGLEVTTEDGRVTVVVWDDGCGFDTGAASGGFGLRNMRHRGELIGATVTWAGGQEGTRVEVSLAEEDPAQTTPEGG